MKFPLITFSWSQFLLSKDGKTLISEASDLENRHLQTMDEGRGFAVQFERRGGNYDVVSFVMIKPNLFQDDDGVASWEYVPTDESKRKYPEYSDMKATVFND
jgi:hypothetical protein